jgi:hypothetical protein
MLTSFWSSVVHVCCITCYLVLFLIYCQQTTSKKKECKRHLRFNTQTHWHVRWRTTIQALFFFYFAMLNPVLIRTLSRVHLPISFQLILRHATIQSQIKLNVWRKKHSRRRDQEMPKLPKNLLKKNLSNWLSIIVLLYFVSCTLTYIFPVNLVNSRGKKLK